jgi:D-lactate dehydrogenase
MKVSIFSAKSYDRQFFTAANAQYQHELTFLEPRLDHQTAPLAKHAKAVCVFVNDEVDKDTIEALANRNVSLIALRSTGYNHIDVQAAKNLGIKLVRVPAYSPNAVAEHTVGLILTLNRKLHRAYNRVRFIRSHDWHYRHRQNWHSCCPNYDGVWLQGARLRSLP